MRILSSKGLGGGGATKWEGGACKVLPYEMGGGQKSCSHVEEEAQKVLG